ncbi:MAG: hypothetical protein EOO09_09005, partial [Chitinophagaceae bacterium]
MKLIYSLLLIFAATTSAMAQTPQSLNYQAIARNASGQIIPSQSVGIRFSILNGSATGSALYTETHTTTTNKFGLFTLGIGNGTPVTGTFPLIDWSTGDKFLRVEVSPAGGSNYTIQGSTQLLSVPYALYAERTRLFAGNNTINVNGNTITANYQAGTAISINGNTISGNYQAGPGISIAGNTISATASSLWVTDNTGIHSVSNNVGVGGNSQSAVALQVVQAATGGSSAAIQLQSADV